MKDSDIENKLKNLTQVRELAEKELEELRKTLVTHHQKVEDKIKELQDLKDMESAMLNKFLNEQKEQIKNMLNISGLKGKIKETKNLFSEVKQKGVDLFNSTTKKIDSKWLDDSYNKYKNECIELGEEITSRDNFKKVMEKIGKKIDDFKHIDYKNLFGVEDEVIVVDAEIVEKKEQRILNSKKEGLQAWIIERQEERCYANYIKFISETYDNYQDLELVYKDSKNSFWRELNKLTT